MSQKLCEIAHSRAGDKGNTLILSLIPFQESDFNLLVKEVSVEKVKAHFRHQVKGEIIRHVLPELKALQFTCFEALTSGVTTSLALDAHGKSLGYALLEMEIDDSIGL
ncbi:hypothetical protein SAMN03080617_02142 [Algoriphagus alkaliphilus]|uniref:AtuA-like ferredoxin-fold domain-containing protein n=1 Tax=Algoriphagus alkaliphilus TaxID=279824 RepID=A0A1G5Y2G9_9BACT|nr:hypothetical protein [Algoriphagus alkaliphilus]MBA4302558.1 hypothetical protein [Cyclobacterium sp.]SDA76135.1 hypothetical protein SAMN03080617_02142 [Algoriphagus alkaliphilus]